MSDHEMNLVEMKAEGDRYLADGRFHDAEQVYRNALAIKDDAADIWFQLGMVLSQLDRAEESLASLKQAAQFEPVDPAVHVNIGRLLIRQGRLSEAVSHLSPVVSEHPRHPEVNLLMGNSLMRLGEHVKAAVYLNRVLAVSPEHVEALFNLSQICRNRGAFLECIGYLTRALSVSPGNLTVLHQMAMVFGAMGAWEDAEACWRKYQNHSGGDVMSHMGLGLSLYHRGRPERAAKSFRHVLKHQPDNTDALNSLGVIYKQLNQLKKADRYFNQVLAINVNHLDAMRNLGHTCQQQGKLESAVRWYSRILEISPSDANAMNGLGVISQKQGDYLRAEEHFRKAIEANSGLTGAYVNLANNLHIQGKVEEARRCYRHVRQSGEFAGIELNLATLSPVIYEHTDQIRRSRRDMERRVNKLLARPPRVDYPAVLYSPSRFFVAYHSLNDCRLMKNLAKLSRAAYPSLAYHSPHCKKPLRKKDRLSIAFISGHFRNHTISRLTRGLIDRLSREQFHVTVVMVGGGSDHETQAILQSADHGIVMSADLQPLRESLARKQFDIIFYPDLGMTESTYLLSFARLAPLQCVTWGHPDTTGVDTIDYFISSTDLEPENAENHYTESLVKLNHLPVYYNRPVLREGDSTVSRSDFGLNDGRNLYLCPQTLFKFHPDFDDILAGVLRGDPDGEIALINQTDHYRDLLRHRWLKRIPDVIDRIHFLPRQRREDFLRLIKDCDVMLDTIHFGGGNTNFEAFGLGTPVVTLPGRFMRGRVAYACYRKMGIDDCIAASAEAYIRIANHLGRDKSYRETVSEQILSKSHEVLENNEAIRELETFLISAYSKRVEQNSGSHSRDKRVKQSPDADVPAVNSQEQRLSPSQRAE